MAKAYETIARDVQCVQWWGLWERLATRFASEAQLVGTLFTRFTDRYDRDDFEDAARAMGLLYDVFHPSTERPPELTE